MRTEFWHRDTDKEIYTTELAEKELIKQQLRTGNAAMREAVRARGYKLAPRLAAKAKVPVNIWCQLWRP